MALPGSVGPNTHIFNSKSKNRGSRKKMIDSLNTDKRLRKTKAMKMTEYMDTGTSERAFTVKCWGQKQDRMLKNKEHKRKGCTENAVFRCLRVNKKNMVITLRDRKAGGFYLFRIEKTSVYS